MNKDYLDRLQRLLQPRHIVVIGGEEARRSIYQCDRFGYEGKIWAVNPLRREMQSRTCLRAVEELPLAPDAAFVAVPRRATIEVVRQLAKIGVGGAVCYASGFAEIGNKGRKLERDLVTAMGDMPVIGPNCYGLLNFQDGVALWPDEHGGKRCQRGVAIISQSGNITVSLTMQQRSLPLALLISTGNMAGVKTHEYIHAMLANPDITAIGLYLEGIPDAGALSEAAIAALKKNIPIVVLESGQSDIGREVTLSHSHSLAGNRELTSAFYKEYGIIQVATIPQLLETLKYVSGLTPVKDRSIASISCSGGEAALMADLAERHHLKFAELTDVQKTDLKSVLGDRVVISNPLDYHTYIWGQEEAQKACFKAIFQGSQSVTVKVLDFPVAGLCDRMDWGRVIAAVIDAKSETNARVVVVSTLHENLPQDVQQLLMKNGVVPMLGMGECIEAISKAADFAAVVDRVDELEPLSVKEPEYDNVTDLTEFQGKILLRNCGIPVVPGMLALNQFTAKTAAVFFDYPVVAKASAAQLVHKTEVNGVLTNIQSDEELELALKSLSKLSSEFLIEKMAPDPMLEMIVGVRRDRLFGQFMIVGAGGVLAELLNETAILFFPVNETKIRTMLANLKVGEILKGYRLMSGDFDGVVDTLLRISEFASNPDHRIRELEINPLYVYPDRGGVLVIDVYCTQFS